MNTSDIVNMGTASSGASSVGVKTPRIKKKQVKEMSDEVAGALAGKDQEQKEILIGIEEDIDKEDDEQ